MPQKFSPSACSCSGCLLIRSLIKIWRTGGHDRDRIFVKMVLEAFTAKESSEEQAPLPPRGASKTAPCSPGNSGGESCETVKEAAGQCEEEEGRRKETLVAMACSSQTFLYDHGRSPNNNERTACIRRELSPEWPPFAKQSNDIGKIHICYITNDEPNMGNLSKTKVQIIMKETHAV